MFAILSRILLGALGAALPSLIGRILLALGIGLVSYTGLTVGTNYLSQYIITNLQGAPAIMAGFLGWVGIDSALNLIFSTFTACLALKTFSKMSITKWAHVSGATGS